MKKQTRYYKIKWISFSATVLILSIGLLVIYLISPQNFDSSVEREEKTPIEYNVQAGHYSNQFFSKMIGQNIAELGFVENIQFKGTAEGFFSISATLKDPERLIAACPELQDYEQLLIALKSETVILNGHLGEQENGCGAFAVDTVSFMNQTIPAGIATSYIEDYTNLNDLLAVPINEICLFENGIIFSNTVPEVIQTASHNPQP